MVSGIQILKKWNQITFHFLNSIGFEIFLYKWERWLKKLVNHFLSIAQVVSQFIEICLKKKMKKI